MAEYKIREIGRKVKEVARHLAYREWAPCVVGRVCIGAGAGAATFYYSFGVGDPVVDRVIGVFGSIVGICTEGLYEATVIPKKGFKASPDDLDCGIW